MKTILVLKMAVAIAAACLFSMGAQSKERWVDDFNGLDANRWQVQDGVNWQGNLSTMMAANAFTMGGQLKLRHRQGGGTAGRQWSGAQMKTKGYMGQGSYKARMQAAGAKPGLDTGFFLYSHSTNEPTPGNGSNYWHEIDYEFLSARAPYNDVHTNIFNANSSGNVNYPQDNTGLNGWASGMHNYEIIWRGDYIQWLYDGREIRKDTRTFGGTMRLHLNIWAPNPNADGSWPGWPRVGNVAGSGDQYSSYDRVEAYEY
jgi:beta-glucanase (GH16 family)